MESEDARICQQAYNEAIVEFCRTACRQDDTLGPDPFMEETIKAGWCRSLFTFREQTSDVPAEISAPVEQHLKRTLACLEYKFRWGSEPGQGGPSPKDSAHSAFWGALFVLSLNGAARKAWELAEMCAKKCPIPVPVALGVSFVAGVGAFAVEKLVENFRLANSGDEAEEN